MDDIRLIPLKCPGCGAKLEISSEMTTFSCAYCGTELLAQFRGGTVSIKPITDALVKVQQSADRTANEIQLHRMLEEISDLKRQKRERSAEWPATLQKLRKEYEKSQEQHPNYLMLFVSAFVVYFVTLMIVFASGISVYGISPTLCSGVLVIALYASILGFTERNKVHEKRAFDQKASSGQAAYDKEMIDCDQRISNLEKQIQAIRRQVESGTPL